MSGSLKIARVFLAVLVVGGICAGWYFTDMTYSVQITDSSVETTDINGTVVEYDSLSDESQSVFIKAVSGSEPQTMQMPSNYGPDKLKEFSNIDYVVHNGNYYQVFYSETPASYLERLSVGIMGGVAALVVGAVLLIFSAEVLVRLEE